VIKKVHTNMGSILNGYGVMNARKPGIKGKHY